MPFKLSRFGSNVPAEVQRWQYFLLRQGFAQAGGIDGDFGLKTETATKFFQMKNQLTADGKVKDAELNAARSLGYSVVPDDYYSSRGGTSYPAAPADLGSPGNETRNRDFTSFRFLQKRRAERPDAEAIVIKGSSDGSIADWTASKIVDIAIPQLKFAKGYSGSFRTHHRAAPVFSALFAAWEAADLLHLVRTYEGCFVARYKRNQAPAGNAGHGLKDSAAVPQLSNHSFGSAFDINYIDNQLGAVPAVCGQRGATRELVDAANKLGIYWGGHFNTKDGMHFEISRLT
ncbi:MAG: M15 family metallopeptidase [Devosia sp.]